MTMFLRGVISHEQVAPLVLPAGASRRMAMIQRNTCDLVYSELDSTGIQRIDGIYSATALGCLEDTERFLVEIDGPPDTLRSPLPFMRSTHNTMAGQLALLMGVTGPNLTFSQSVFGFHAALLNALLHLDFAPKDNVLVFAADERTELSQRLVNALRPKGATLGEGVEAFVLGGVPGPSDVLRITHVEQRSVTDNERWDAWFKEGFDGTMIQHVICSTFPVSDEVPRMGDGVKVERPDPDNGIHGASPAQALARLVAGYAKGAFKGPGMVLDRFSGQQGAIVVQPC